MSSYESGMNSENEQVRLNREEANNLAKVKADNDKPACYVCNKEILDGKNILICKGECKGIFHYECALKQDKSLAHNRKVRSSRKFECKSCTKKAMALKNKRKKKK